MQINIKDEESKKLDITSASVKEVLLELGINPLEVVVKKNDKNNHVIVHEDEKLTNEDEITVIKVVFGG